MSFQESHLFLYAIRVANIVKILSNNKLTRCKFNGFVQRTRKPQATEIEYSHSLVSFRNAFQEFLGIVSRSIVDNDPLERFVGLSQNAGHRPVKIGFPIIDSCNDAYFQRIFLLCSRVTLSIASRDLPVAAG